MEEKYLIPENYAPLKGLWIMGGASFQGGRGRGRKPVLEFRPIVNLTA